jgi:ABC-type phosphate/phosphonate transport system substrate-binding protein
MPQHAKGTQGLSRLILGLILLFFTTMSQAANGKIVFAVQPILEREATIEFYQPLVTYLRKQTGLDIELVASINFLTYWQKMRRGEFDLVLDAAHFTGYRMTNLGYTPIAKVPGTVTYSLVTGGDLLIFEPEELIGKLVACAAPPSLGMLRLQEMFPNPLRQPVIKESPSAETALALLDEGKVVAAMVPTPLLNNYPGFNVVATTQPSPHVTFSVAPSVPDKARDALQQALLGAAGSPEGKNMLESINFPSLEKPSRGLYDGYEQLLSDTWGF